MTPEALAIRAAPATGDDAMRGVEKVRKTACTAALAAAAILAGTASWADGGPEPVGSCQADAAGGHMDDMNGQVAELVRAAQQRLQQEQGPGGDPDFIVLNNRGYNYGPPPSVRFEPIGLERAPADPHAQ